MAFKFGNNLAEIEIENRVFFVPVNAELQKKILKAKDIIGENKENWDITDKNAIAEFVAIFDGFIDDILGDGAAAKIFADRKINVYDRIAVFIYICTEIMAFANSLTPQKVE